MISHNYKMSTSKKILAKLESLESKIDELLNTVSKLENASTTRRPEASAPSPNYPPVVTKVDRVILTKYKTYCLLTGNTFDIRNDFKALGGKWDGDSKGWKIKMTNIDDFATFQKELSNKCVTLKIKEGIESTATIPKPSLNFEELGDCMIDDSSDSE